MSERPAAVPICQTGFALPRLYRHDEDLPILVDLVRDSFSDHYGHIEQSFDKRYCDLYPPLVSMAALTSTPITCDARNRRINGHHVAGSTLPLTEFHRRPGVGYIDMVGVRRAFRRRGLASAMLRRSFAELLGSRDQGQSA